MLFRMGPNGMEYGGWWSGMGTLTGASPKIEMGGSADDTISAYLTGQIAAPGISSRCLTDREVFILCNPGTDGSNNVPPYGGTFGGREWPFTY